jgi:histidinol phosphatase-like enzyme (inositol monophosphatase family)
VTPAADRQLLDDAVDLARRAGDLTLRWFRSTDLVVERKGDGSPVTEADKSAERMIRAELAERYANDAILGEEEGVLEGSSGRRWFIDPIDGTKAFTHGVPLYTTLLAVDDAHGPAVGVIHMPALGETVYAGRGLGCFCNEAPARVSDRTTLPGGYLTTSGFDYWDEDALLAVRGSGLQMRTWGDGYGYALVATGRVDVMVDPVAGAWDLAPMPVVISEAGGRFTDATGAPRIDGGSGVASNGDLHEPVLELLRASAARPRPNTVATRPRHS